MLKEKDNNLNIINDNIKDGTYIDIYFITCFHKIIWESKLFDLTSSNKSVVSIINKLEKDYHQKKDKNDNYLIILHQINIKNNYNDIEKISLLLSHKNNDISLNLGEIILKSEEERFFFNNFSFESNKIKDIKEIKERELNINNNNKNINYYLELDYSMKLNIFYDFIQNNNMVDNYSSFLVNNYLFSAKNQVVLYSDIIKLFTLSHGKQNIITFFDNCYNFKFNIDKVNNINFTNLLNLYFENKDIINEKNEVFFYEEKKSKKVKNNTLFKKYKKDIDNFMSLYKLFNEKTKNKVFDKKKLLELDIILINMLNNHDNILEYLKFLFSNFFAFYNISLVKKGKDRVIKIDKSKIGTINFGIKELLDVYSFIISQQEIEKFYFINASEIIEYATDYCAIELDQMLALKEIYLKEEKYFSNPKLVEKMNKLIHTKLFELEEKGEINNNSLLNYLLEDEIYTNNSNNNYKELKDITILEGFNLTKMDEKFLKSYNENKVYQLFEDTLNKYLSVYSKKIKHMKYFGLFFKLLPPEKYDLDTISVVTDWLQQKIKTYNKEECPSFPEEINIFIDILKKFGDKYIHQFIDIIKDNLNAHYLELFVGVLNTNKDLNPQNKEYIITCIINNQKDINNKNNLNLENTLYFIKEIKTNSQTEQIFLNKLGIYHLLRKDFYNNTEKYKLFTNLLNDKIFSLINSDNNKNTLYWEKTKLKCTKILEELRCLDIDLSNTLLTNFNEENINKCIINLINCIEENDPEMKSQIIIYTLKLYLDKWENKKKDLNTILKYEDTFFKEEERSIKKEINDLFQETKNMKKIKEKAFDEELSKYNDAIKTSYERLKLNESLLFKEIYNKYQKNFIGKERLLKFCENSFNKIINILECDINNIEENKDNEDNIELLFFIYYRNEKDLNIEIDWIYKYFKKDNSSFKDNFKLQILINSKRKILKYILSGIIIIIENISNNKLTGKEKEIYDNLKKYKNDIEKNNNITLDTIKDIIDYIIQRIDIDLNLSEKNKKLYELLFSIANCPESIQFIKNKKSSEISNLMSFWLDNNESGLTADVLNNFINIVDIFQKWLYKYINNEKSIYEIIKIMFEDILNDNKIKLSFESYINIYKDIHNLFDKFLKPTDGCIKMAKLILEQSAFYISLIEKNKKYEIHGQYKINIIEKYDAKPHVIVENNEIKVEDLEKYNKIIQKLEEFSESIFLNFKDLKILEQRILISKIPEKEKKFLDIYLQSLKNIKELLNILNDLYSRGYREKVNIRIYFYNYENICMNNQIIIKLNELVILYKTIKKEIKSNWETRFFQKDSLINLLYGRQIYLIYNNIIDKKEYLNLDLLKAISNSNIQKLDYSLFQKADTTDNESIMNQIQKYLYDLMIFNNKEQKNIFLDNKIKEDFNDYIGIYFCLSLNQDVDSLFIYQQFTDHLPINACFLYCTVDTSSDEIINFIYRIISCEQNILFCIIYPELLSGFQSKILINTINRLVLKYYNINSCLLIMVNNKESDIYHYLIKNKKIQYFYYFNEEKDLNTINKEKATIISSNECGFGKSELINDKMKLMDYNKWQYIYFPLGGKFNKDNLIKRIELLPNMNNEEENFYIHIDLNQLEEIFLAKEFLFKILILNKYDIYENIKYFGKNVRFGIEIPNDSKNYFNEIKILSFFNQNNLSLNKIKESKEFNIVSNILFMYESNDIINKNYNINSTKNILTNEQGNEIVLKYLKNIGIKNPNFYQINIFIKILFEEFSRFSKCKCFFPNILKENAMQLDMTNEEALELRKIIIESLIEMTKLFIFESYEYSNKNQEIKNNTINVDNVQINDEIGNEIMDRKQKINNYFFDNKCILEQIKNSLIIFNDDKKSCTIIPVCSEEEPEYILLEKIHNFQNYDLAKLNSNNLLITKNIKFNDNKNKQRSLSFFINKNMKIEDIFKEKSIKNMINIKSLKSSQILDILLKFLNINEFNYEKKKKILDNFVFTPENFIKLILILLRIRAKIPIILMGDIGCGKSYLIEMASKLINRGNNTIYKMTINSGTTNEDINQFIKKIITLDKKEDKKILENQKKEENSIKKSNTSKSDLESFTEDINNRLIWIFFEEINTSYSIGLLTEILLKKTIYGKPLDERFVFIASCNPYRMLSKNIDLNNFIINKKKKSKLVYKVNSLPLSLLNFVFNFGNVNEEDEKKYIKNMVKNYFNKIIQKEKKNVEEFLEKIISIGSECVILCHNFIKENNEISIINLKDVNKFLELFEYSSQFLFLRKDKFSSINNDLINNEILEFYKDKTEYDIYCCSINISIYICYYLQLVDNKNRNKLVEILNKGKYFNNGDFLKLPIIEQNYLINNLQIDVGISKNKALKENLFILFFCIINKLPVIILGKSGRSKSLAIKILESSMRGSFSKSFLCKLFPELFVFHIQGTLNTTSKDISRIFEKAEKCYFNNKNKLIAVFFENMGITEDNDDNPLKIIHSDIEAKKSRIIFMGTSNWALEPSIMSRVIYNIVQDPDEEEIINIGEELIKSYENKDEKYFEKYKNFISEISKAYFSYKKNKDDNKDLKYYEKMFHGMRDFYNLIKSIMNDIIKYKGGILELEEERIKKICMLNIERNFGGLNSSIQEFKAYFLKNNNKCTNEYNILKYIKNNINDESSRYLLLVLDNFMSKDFFNFIIQDLYDQNYQIDKNEKSNLNIINEENNNEKKGPIIKYFFGSKFKLDKNNSIYSKTILDKIKYEMEKENIIILKDLDCIYPFLYDLFDQNYIYLENKKFVRIGKSKSLSLLNNKFKLILLEDKENIPFKNSTFLKYFEKHIMSYSFILNDKLNLISNEIIETLNNILKYDTNDNIINKLKKHLFFINEDGIKSLVYMKSKEFGNIDKNKIISFILELIIPCLTEELMVLVCKYNFRNNYKDYYESIYNIYKKNYCYNLQNYLEKLNNEISIIYTFSSVNGDIMDNLFYNKKSIKNSIYDITFEKSSTKEINISSIYSINKLEIKLKNFIFEENNKIRDTKKNLLIIKLKEKEINKTNDIYYLIKELKSEDTLIQRKYKTKIILFIVNISKKNNNKNIKNIEYILDTPQIFINDLYNTYNNFLDLLLCSNIDIINKPLVDINIIINNNIDSVLRFFDYNIININNNNLTINNNYKLIIIEAIKKKEFARKILLNCIINFIKNEEDFVINSFNDNIINNENPDIYQINFLNIFYNYFNDKIFMYLLKIVFLLEKELIIKTIQFNSKIYNEEIIKKYLDKYISNINKEELIRYNWSNPYLNEKIQLNIILESELPLLTKIYDKLILFIKSNISLKYIEAETSFIYKNIKIEMYNKAKDEYLETMKQLTNNLKLEINKYDILSEILKSNNMILINATFNDYLLIYINKLNLINKNFVEYSLVLSFILQFRIKYNNNKELDNIFYQEKNIKIIDSLLDLVEISEEKNEEDNLEIIEEKYYYLDLFVYIISFLESYSKELKYILELYDILHQFNSNVLKYLKDIIRNKQIEIDKKDIKNICFFYIIESLIKIFNTKISDIFTKTKNNFNQRANIIKLCQFFFQNITKLEKRFLINSKEILSLKINIKLINHFEIKKHIEQEELTTICNIMKYVSNNSVENETSEHIMTNLTIINNLLIKIFGKKTKEYNEIMNNILFNQYKSIRNISYQDIIIKILLSEDNKKSNEKLIKKSYPLIQAIFDFESLEPIININNENSNIINEKLQKKFLNIFKNYNPIKEYINNRDHVKLNKIILYHFEIICDNYFKKIKDNKNNDKLNIYKSLCCGTSKDYLEESLNYLDQETSGKKHDGLNIIEKLYCIAYIKRYLIYYIDILLSNDYQYIDERNDINKKLFGKNVLIRKIIKYYLLKICFEKHDSDYDKLVTFFTNNDIFGFKEYFNDIHLIKDNIQFDMPFLQIDLEKNNYNKYEKLLSNNKEKRIDYEEIYNFFIKSNSYDYLYTFLANISLLSCYEKNIENKYNNFKIMLDLINKYLIKENIFENDLKTFIDFTFENQNQDLNLRKLEIIIYSFRFIFNLLIIKKNNNNKIFGFYYNLLTNGIEQTLKDNYIPGNFPHEIVIIHNLPEIKDNLTSNPNKDIILCSCGYYYKEDNIKKCPICGETLNEEEDDSQNSNKKPKYQISFNEKPKKGFISSIFSGKNKSVDKMSLKEFEKKINNKNNNIKKNISPPIKNIFLFRNDKIREIDELTYRFLNYLLYSFIFYSELIGNIKENIQQKYYIENMNIFEIMEKDWEIMDEIVRNKQIPNIQTFFNIIFTPINEKITNNINKTFHHKEDLINFEKEINEIINEQLNKNVLIEQYIKQNNILLGVEPFSDKSIIIESEPCEIYLNDKYPEIEYFTNSKLPNKDNFINKFNSNITNKNKYPITNLIINHRMFIKRLQLLQYLPVINEICNDMIKYCSYQYSREEAKQIKIENEIKEPNKKNLIEQFYVIYEKLRPQIKKFDCHDLNKGFNNLRSESYLSNFCVDTNEVNYGMIIAGIYQKMIEIQNSFINIIINSSNERLKNYANLFIIKIMIQDCNKDEIIKLPLFDDDIDNKNKEENKLNNDMDNNDDNDKEKINIMKIIIDNSYYYDNNYMEYNFDSIEDTLASLILPKIKRFYSPQDSEKYLRTVVYQYEGFRGNITEYLEKYQQRKLTEVELNIVINFIINQKNQNFDMKSFLFSLQILIDIILSNNYKKNESLYKVIMNIKDNSNIFLIKNFFNKIKTEEEYNDSLFTVECLIDLMNFLEMFYWDKIKNNLDKDYLVDINNDIKLKFDNIYNNKKILITKELLCTAIRRFITRYLIGKREENKINPKNNLYLYIDKIELWPIDLKKNEQFKEELTQLFGLNESNYISVGNSLKLYEYLGGDLNSLKELLKKKNEEINIKKANNITELKEEEDEDKDKDDMHNNIINNSQTNDEENEGDSKSDEEEINDIEENEEEEDEQSHNEEDELFQEDNNFNY